MVLKEVCDMRRGTPFEVSKEVFERARANSGNQSGNCFYMAEEDKEKLFSIQVLCGYGLYNCKVREDNGKYICTYETGDSCD